MELDPVVESFEARVGPWLAGIDLAIEAAKAFEQAVHADVAAIEELNAALAALPEQRTVHVRFDTSGLPETFTAGAAAGAGVTDAAAFDAQAEAMRAAAAAAFDDAAAQEAARAATEDSGNAARRAMRYWGLLPLTFTAIHWAVTGTAEALAVVIPAMVAAGSAGLVGLQGAVDVADRLRAVYTTTEATASYLGKTISTGLGQGINQYTASAGQAAGAGNQLRDSLQKAQDAAMPRVYELLGAAVDGASGKFDVFNQVGGQTIDMLDRFAAKIDIELRGPMGNLGNQLAHNAVPDLQGLGQAFGNVGHAVANAAAAMPGMAELLLRILDAGTQLLVWATHFHDVLIVAFAAHEAQMWGGLLRTALVSVSGALAAGAVNLGAFAARAVPFEAAATGIEDASLGMGAALESTAAFLSGPWGLAIGAAAVAVALFGPRLLGAKDATQQWISSLEGIVNQARGLQQIADTYSALQQVTAANAAAQRGLAESTAQFAAAARSHGVQAAAVLASGQVRAAQDAGALSGAQKQLSQDFATETGNVKLLSGEYKIGYAEAAQLAADAGVSLTQSLKGNSIAAQEARQMIANLIAGYGVMAAVGTELGQDINAVSFAAAIQNGNITKLNQAWDTFISTVQAPSSTFLSFAQSLAQFSQDARQAGASMDGFGGAVARSAPHVNTAAIQLQQDFNSSVTSAQSMLDSMRTVAAITGNGGPLVQGIKDTVAALIPMAGTNEAARAQLFALAQEAGGPASGSLRDLAKWAGNTKDPLGNLYTLSMQAAGAIQKLGADTQALAATMQSSLNQTLVTQAQALTGVSAKTAAYLRDLQTLGPDSLVTQGALDTLNNSVSQANTLASNAAGSVQALSGKITDEGHAARGAHPARQQVITDIQGILDRAPGASTDINSLMTAIQNQGARSSAASGARAQLIKDLEAMHVNAQTATSWVDALIAAIEHIPPKKTVTITMVGQTVGFSMPVPGGGVNAYPVKAAAAGWKVPGHGSGDTVPAMLAPGEAVVPKHLVPAITPFLAAHHVPGFEAGGLAGHWLPAGFPGGHGSAGGAGGTGMSRSPQPLHVHLSMDGRQVAEAILPDLVAATADYTYQNSGRPTGKLLPGS